MNLVNPDYTWAINPNNKEEYEYLFSSSSGVAVLNQISNITGEFRDHAIVDTVVDAVDAGKSPSAVYGDGHAVKLKPALSYLYTQMPENSK